MSGDMQGSHAYDSAFDPGTISPAALEVARQIRGREHGATIMVHGVMPRCGTVYTGELLRLHPAVHAYANQMWEFPLLRQTEHLLRLAEGFFHSHTHNVGKIGEHDFLPLFGSAVLTYLHSFVPAGSRMLLKTPDVFYLHYLPALFPFENAVLLLRDGRDVVSSTLRTWPERMTFAEVCERWQRSTESMLAFVRRYDQVESYWLVKYEDVVARPHDFVREGCRRFGLDPAGYPFERIDGIPVRGSSPLLVNGQVTWEPQPKPKDFTRSGHWHSWSRAEVDTFKQIAGQTLIDAGYCADLDW